MELIVISDPTCFKDEAKIVNQLFEAGLQIFHLKKDGCDREMYKQLITEIDEAYHDRIALHQFHDLVADFSVKRIHYSEKHRKNMPEKDWIRSHNLHVLSTSIHQLNEPDSLVEFDYTFFGPMYNSISKPGYAGILTEDFILPKGIKGTKIIALGGINMENAVKIKQMKFDGIGVLGSIWNNPLKAVTEFKNLQRRCKDLM